MRDDDQKKLSDTRFFKPEVISDLARQRTLRTPLFDSGRILIVAADHPARGSIKVGERPHAMANRIDLLNRIVAALGVPGVDGVLGTPDIIEDLLLLGALDNKVVFGSMNRGGLPGAVFEMDDRFTCYSAASIINSRLDGGKMLLRINTEDPGTINTLESCASAVTELASARRIAMVEPFMNKCVNGRNQNDLTTDAVVRSMGIASALGSTSAYTWLKVPVVEDMARIAEASTLPIVLLGGEQRDSPDEMFSQWEKALHQPGVRGLVVGRNLLYPANDDVEAAVKIAASLL
ncbi:MAG TPA: deoxyribose-phosphate aldolase [Acidimicrobiales bacterium]|nr:deoxyribose-phosphate aldolase [Acidimicrobiales bacterium]